MFNSFDAVYDRRICADIHDYCERRNGADKTLGGVFGHE